MSGVGEIEVSIKFNKVFITPKDNNSEGFYNKVFIDFKKNVERKMKKEELINIYISTLNGIDSYDRRGLGDDEESYKLKAYLSKFEDMMSIVFKDDWENVKDMCEKESKYLTDEMEYESMKEFFL